MPPVATAEVAYTEQQREGAVEGGQKRLSQINFEGLREAYNDHNETPEGVDEGLEVIGDVKEGNKANLANKCLDYLPFRVSVCLVAIALFPVFIIGIMYAFGAIEWDYKIQTATGLSLGISLLDLLKERVIALTNNNLSNYFVPGRNLFKVGRELAFFWVWIPMGMATYHWTTTLGIFFEFLLATAQALIGTVKPEDIEADEGWAKGFIIAGLGVAVPAILYCLAIEKIGELESGVPLPVTWNLFSRAEESSCGSKFLSALGFALKYQEQARDLVMGGNMGNADPEDQTAPSNPLDGEEWEVCHKDDPEAVPIFGKAEVDMNVEPGVPNPKSIVALAVPVLGSVSALGSITLYGMLYHDLSVDDADDRYFGETMGFEVSGHALSGAQLLMVLGWMAVSILAGLAFVDHQMQNAFKAVTSRDPEQRIQDGGFEYLKTIPDPVQRKQVQDQVMQYPSSKEYHDILSMPFGVVEGVGQAMMCQLPDARSWFAAILANFAKYFIVCRALTFAVYDNDDQGFLMWYVVPEGLGIIALMVWFYNDSWEIWLADPNIRCGPTGYRKRKVAREVVITERPRQLWLEQAGGGGVRPMPGYSLQRPIVPNVPTDPNRTVYGPVPGMPLPFEMYAVPPPENTMGVPRLYVPGVPGPGFPPAPGPGRL